MIPTFYKHLLKEYLKIFFLSVASFIALLLITRLKEIARFASICINKIDVVYFTSYQIPYILPLAIPISCLIATLLLFSKMSQNHELTALRSNGLSIYQIAYPVLFIGFILFLFNILIISEISPRSRIKAKNILYEESSINPIELLQRQQLLRIKDSFIDITPSRHNSKKAKNLYYIYYNKNSDRLDLCLAKKIELKEDNFIAQNVSFLTHLPTSLSYDHLFLENQQLLTNKANQLSQIMKKGQYKLTNNYLPFRLLFIHHNIEKKKSTIISEITHRFAMGLSAFSLTFIGMAFGINISRFVTKRHLLTASLLALIILMSFAIGKSFKYSAWLSSTIYLIPQIICLWYAKKTLDKVSKGIE